jgi:hypothetical protein
MWRRTLACGDFVEFRPGHLALTESAPLVGDCETRTRKSPDVALGQTNGRSLASWRERRSLAVSAHLARFYAAALLTRSAENFEVGNIWLPERDVARNGKWYLKAESPQGVDLKTTSVKSATRESVHAWTDNSLFRCTAWAAERDRTPFQRTPLHRTRLHAHWRSRWRHRQMMCQSEMRHSRESS